MLQAPLAIAPTPLAPPFPPTYKYEMDEGEHFDQGTRGAGLQHIQSVTAFVDQEEEDACFLCWPRSHEHHQRLTEGTWRGRSHWVPLTDATLDTGCLHVVPRDADRLFDEPEHPDHLRPARSEADGGQALRFPAGAARAIPAEAGSVCVWAGQTIHYGSPCRLTARDMEPVSYTHLTLPTILLV